MRPREFDEKTLKRFLRRQKTATMLDLKAAMQAPSDATIFRMLSAVGYLSSYSHRGRYYTLKDVPDFDELGLWSHRSVFFSKAGTLVATAQVFVEESSSGYYADELEAILKVNVKDVLPRLAKQSKIGRQKINGRFLYCSKDASIKKQQTLARTRKLSEVDIHRGRVDAHVVPKEVKAAIVLFFALLDEQQRRMFAGLESMKWGYGGDAKIAELLQIDVKTVARGREQLLLQEFEPKRTRKPGGGRKPIEKKARTSSPKSTNS